MLLAWRKLGGIQVFSRLLMSGVICADCISAVVRLREEYVGVRSERRTDREIVLHRDR
jgi:hypothetical protein